MSNHTPRARGGHERPGLTDDNPMAITIMVAIFAGMLVVGVVLGLVLQPSSRPSPPGLSSEYVPAQLSSFNGPNL
jgi:hypothetical protein